MTGEREPGWHWRHNTETCGASSRPSEPSSSKHEARQKAKRHLREACEADLHRSGEVEVFEVDGS